MASQDGGTGRDSLRTVLHNAVDREQFDYDALVAGVHQRAGRIRRRRAITTGVAVAVLGPALVGGAALVLPEILPGGDSAVVGPATGPDGPTVVSTPTDDAGASGGEATDGEATDDAGTTGAPEDTGVRTPPWQDEAPPLPEGGLQVNEEVPNAWEIPDARPTGVAALDALGTPQLAMSYPRTVPVMGLMSCDPGREGGAGPEAAQSFDYFTDTPGDPTINIQVTGWQDSTAARDGLLTDSYTLCTWDGDPGAPQPWPGHEGDEDYLLFTPEGSDRAAAVVRQGDYLVAVTVHDDDTDEAVEVAGVIASWTADNLEALDPVHGRD